MKIKSTFRKKLRRGLVAITMAAGLFSCKKPEIQGNIVNSFASFGANTTISKIIAGSGNTTNPVFWAYVTASGAAQNAPAMLWVQDETGGIAIKLQQDQSAEFTPGTLILVHTDGLKVQREGAFFLLGLPDGDSIQALSETDLDEYITIAARDQVMGVNQITLDQLDATYNQQVVTISDVEVADEHLTGTFGPDTEPEKEIILQDCSGNEITLVTSKDAELASVAIKTGHGNLTGLVTVNNGVKQIRLLNAAAADVLIGARCIYQQYADHKYFVTPNGNATNDGKSWETAKTLEAAIAVAVSGDSIFVSKGTYVAPSGNPLISLSAANDGIKLYGGFAGTETVLRERVFGTTAADSTNFVGNGNRVIYNYATAAAPITAVTYDGFTVMGGTGSTGGGMSNTYASVTVANCIFKGNTPSASGGGIYNTQNTITVTNCKFYGNIAGNNGGGGLLLSTGSSGTITNCTFDSNVTNSGNGAGVSTYTSAANPTTVTITNCTFLRNTANGNGGGLYNYADVATTVSGCTFLGNKATLGAGVYNNTSAAVTYANCLFSGNKSSSNGGGMYNASGSVPVLINCTIAGNNAANGGGMYSTGAATLPVLTNCIVYGNNNGIVNVSSASVTVTYSNVQYAGGSETNYSSGTGNINADPLFVNAPAYSAAPFTGGTYTLQSTSPAINTGSNGAVSGYTTDLEGNSRIYNDTVDMGAYERQN